MLNDFRDDIIVKILKCNIGCILIFGKKSEIFLGFLLNVDSLFYSTNFQTVYVGMYYDLK